MVLGFPVTTRVSLAALFFLVKTSRAVNLLFFWSDANKAGQTKRRVRLVDVTQFSTSKFALLVSSIQSLQTLKIIETGAGKMLDGQRFFPVLRVQSRAGSHGFLSSLRLLVRRPQNRKILEKKNLRGKVSRFLDWTRHTTVTCT